MGNVCSLSISTEDTIPRCWDCISGQASYTCKLEQNLKALSMQLEKLEAQRDDVNRMVDLAEQQLMKRLSRVQVWLSRVQTVVADADQLIEDGPREIQKLCFVACFSKNCKSSYKFGKKVAEKIKEIAELRNEGVFEKVAENEPAPRVDVRPTEPTVGLESTLGKVLSLLEGKEVGIIGLHGLGGVGKTTLLTQINNKLSNMLIVYDVVIWVVVSKDHTIENVQQKIGDKLGLSNELWMNKSSDEKAIVVFRVLSKKKFILLMDDVWEGVNLIKVGIPVPNQENGCKIIFTTRFLEVCGQMGAREKIKVECLRAKEAWTLFEQKVGEETLNSHPDIRKLAKQVAAKCGGLPLALIIIGKAMACKKMIEDWKYAIEVLKEFPHKLARMDQEVYSLLKFSYDCLPNDTMRHCFLYCSLFPEDCRIDKNVLIDYWLCEGLLDEFKNASRAQLQGNNIINCLNNACLLERCDKLGDFVKMHDVIRDMALWIAHECEALEKTFLVQAGVGSSEAVLNVEGWEGARMSLVINGIEELRGTPTCPNLRTLFLIHNKLRVISDGFFRFMPSLRVLNLSWNEKLGVLPEGMLELVSLECLDLQWTGIIELPISLNRLSNLKYLNLNVTLNLKKIPRQLICNLSKLQIFRICYSEGGPDEDNVLHGGYEGLIEELKCLQHLSLLNIELKSAFALQSFLSSHNLSRCTELLSLSGFRESKELDVLPLVNLERLDSLLIIGFECIEEMKMEIVREIEGKRMIKTSRFPNMPHFHNLRRVVIIDCDELRGISFLFHVPNLTWLCIVRCQKLEAIMSEGTLSGVRDGGIPNSKPFGMLEMLDLRDLPKLKTIFWDVLPFPCLRNIKIFNCPKLKKLPLNLDNAKGNQISIEGYEEWWEEVEWDDEATRNAFLPSFKCSEWWKEMEDEPNFNPRSLLQY